MNYQHRDNVGQPINLPVGKVVCVGRNYLDHIKELGNPIPQQAILFIKPSTSIVEFKDQLSIPNGNCHNELEIAVLIGQQLCNATSDQVKQAVWGMGLALDLTLRDVQSELKSKGYPWERAKAFDGSCPLGRFIPASDIPDWQNIEFSLLVNQQLRQSGTTALMMKSTLALIQEISQTFTLLPGDVVLTGTPKGVAQLNPEDKLEARLGEHLTEVAEVCCE